MSNSLKEFGETAKGLARNPLGIIALFIVLIYGFAALVVGFSGQLQASERIPIVWFLVVFPVIVLAVFAWLVSKHHRKLYAPSDFKDETHFIEAYNPTLTSLEFAQPVSESEGQKSIDSPNEWSNTRKTIYQQNRGYFLAHVLEPSREEGQEYEIFIYLIRHKSEDYSDIEKAEFFFGHYWGNKIYKGTKIGKLIGVKTSAYGPFLVLCKITFRDGESVVINKYIDFEMGFAVKKLINR